MGRLHHEMASCVDQRQLLLGISTPEHKYYGLSFRIYLLDDGVGKSFPSFALVRVCLVGADRQYRIQHENALFRPGNQKSVFGSFAASVIAQLFVDVSQGRWGLDSRTDTEAEAMCLPRAMVRVLAQQKNPYLSIRGELKG